MNPLLHILLSMIFIILGLSSAKLTEEHGRLYGPHDVSHKMLGFVAVMSFAAATYFFFHAMWALKGT